MRRKRCIIFVLVILSITAIILYLSSELYGGWHTIGRYSKWDTLSQTSNKPRRTNIFAKGSDEDIFIYSAIAKLDRHINYDYTVVVTSLDKTYAKFSCCFLLGNHMVYISPAREYFTHIANSKVRLFTKLTGKYDEGHYRARQHTCYLPNTAHNTSLVTLTSSSKCPTDINTYVNVTYRTNVPGGIALCGKIAHSGGIDPEKFIEWVEVNRILGVDKIMIYNLGNPLPLTRVFRYYQKLGVLDVLPYELPGDPRGRTLSEAFKRTVQFSHDETLALMECRERMGGYSFVLSHDVDEFLIPRQDVDLKTFFNNKMLIHPDSAGFFFYTEFFIYLWKPTSPEQDLMVTRYAKATRPRFECFKYIFLPGRVYSTVTHDIHPYSPYKTSRISSDEIVLHHYRQCPDVWATCYPNTIIDNTMTRFTDKHRLYQRVLRVRNETNIKPKWVPYKRD